MLGSLFVAPRHENCHMESCQKSDPFSGPQLNMAPNLKRP